MKTLLEGQLLGRYELKQYLGGATLVEDWKAFDPQLVRPVMLKCFHPSLYQNAEVVQRFQREAPNLASLHHPNIVPIYSVEFESHKSGNSRIYLVTEFIEGQTLADYLQRVVSTQHLLSPTEIAHLFASLCAAVEYAHQAGVLHGNLKPANILLDKQRTRNNAMGEPVLTDFGIAAILGTPGNMRSYDLTGTPLYASPEQIQGRAITPASDVYSLGAILFELCTGRPPFQGHDTLTLAQQHISALPPAPRQFNPALSEILEVVILRCLAKDPAARFARVSLLLEAALEALQVSIFTYQDGPTHLIQISQPLREPIAQPSPVPPAREPIAQPSQVPSAMATGIVPPLAPPLPRGATPHPSIQSPSFNPPPQPALQSKRRSVPFQRRLGIWGTAGVLLLLVITLLTTWLGSPLGSGNASSEQTVVGRAFFTSSESNQDDIQQGANDTVQVVATIPDAHPGYHYYAWLMNTAQSESNVFPLGPLVLSNGKATLAQPYTTPTRTNLLATANSILITEESARITPINPSLDKKTWRYMAMFSQTPAANGMSQYQHLQHLLWRDPILYTKLGIDGGVKTLLLNRMQEIWKWSMEARDLQDAPAIRQKLINLLYALHGTSCVQPDLSRVPAGAIREPESESIVQAANVPLLACLQATGEPYLIHVASHVEQYINSPGVPSDLARNASQIKLELALVDKVSSRMLTSVQQLITLSDTQLTQATAQRNDLASLANNALTGWIDPATGQEQSGVQSICNEIQRLATLEVTAVH